MSGIGPTDPWASAGSYFDPSNGSGYISSAEMQAWLANVTGDKWGELRGEMMTTDARHELMEDLGNLKTELEKVADTKDTTKVRQALSDMEAKYAGTTYEAKVNDLVESMAPAIDEKDRAYANVKTVTVATTDAEGNTTGFTQIEEGRDHADELNEKIVDQIKGWSEDVTRKIDVLGRDDQLALIRIQELQSNITQQVNLASNLLKSDDQAKSAIIMNVKG